MPQGGSQHGANVFAPAARAVYRARRTAATVAAILLALVFGWHAFFGHNGITAYAQKRAEDRALRAEIQKLTETNAALSDKVNHLESDPDTIELEARRRLHYTRPGEVVYALGERAPNAAPPAQR